MKTSIATILLILYVIPTIGININVHYCSQKISSVSLFGELANPCACCGGKKMKKDCCKEKKLTFKIESEQQRAMAIMLDFSKIFTNLESVIPTYTFSFSPIATENIFYNDYHPPDHLKQPLYILHQVFQI